MNFLCDQQKRWRATLPLSAFLVLLLLVAAPILGVEAKKGKGAAGKQAKGGGSPTLPEGYEGVADMLQFTGVKLCMACEDLSDRLVARGQLLAAGNTEGFSSVTDESYEAAAAAADVIASEDEVEAMPPAIRGFRATKKAATKLVNEICDVKLMKVEDRTRSRKKKSPPKGSVEESLDLDTLLQGAAKKAGQKQVNPAEQPPEVRARGCRVAREKLFDTFVDLVEQGGGFTDEKGQQHQRDALSGPNPHRDVCLPVCEFKRTLANTLDDFRNKMRDAEPKKTIWSEIQYLVTHHTATVLGIILGCSALALFAQNRIVNSYKQAVLREKKLAEEGKGIAQRKKND